ncbi:ATP-binding cassette domain-containing protein, partial [Lysinibacillus sp. D4A3_S15]|uniref:ATP-binding cassette domain-containing protein n=1 Tax=Lysinibacillus sp. D4A3_S15 TaxID=2941227 RepID=UPI0020C16683
MCFLLLWRCTDREDIVTITNLTKSAGNNEILKGINLHATRGEIIGYIGPNGAGKSTTVKIILGLEGDYGGEIKLFGESIGQEHKYDKRR